VSDWVRGERRRGALRERFGPRAEDVVGTPPDPDRGRLADCLRRLGPRDRAVVVLTYYADRDGGEIARDLAMSAGNVRVARFRALKLLLACMEGGS
jgi:DNA-directed RNA polymerase specialized sigma24 family protein